MAVSMTFYSDFSKRENSTKRPYDGTEYDIVFKDSFSLIGGSVILQVSFDTAKTYTAAKYGDFYYYVTDVISEKNNIVEIQLSLDVLATYKYDISSYTSMIERCPDAKNIVNIVDNTISPLPTNTRKDYPMNVFAVGISFQIKTKNGNGDLAYFLDVTAFNNLLVGFEAAFWTEETQYVVSTKIVTIPASSCGGTAVTNVYIGNQPYPISSGACYAVKSAGYIPLNENVLNMSSIVTKYTDERRYNNNYVNVQAVLNGEIVQLEANYLRYTSFKAESFLDPLTLDVRLMLHVVSGNTTYLLVSKNTNIGVGFMFVDTPNVLDVLVSTMSSTTHADVTKGVKALPDGGLFQGAPPADTSFRNLAKQSLHGAGIGIASTFASGVGSVLAHGYKAGMQTHTSGSPSGSSIAAVTYGDTRIYITEYDSIDKNPSELGYPYMQITNISSINMTGYYKFSAPQLRLPAVYSVKEAVNRYLANGFFYE